jgi:multiple sugar transport system permease protein
MTKVNLSPLKSAQHPHIGPTESRSWNVVRRMGGWVDSNLAVMFLVPGLTCLLALTLYPVVYNIAISFTNSSLLFPGIGFNGLVNYRQILTDPEFWWAAARTLVWTLVSVGGQLLLGFAAALALERVTKGRSLLRLMLIVPWAFPSVVLANLWRFMLDPLYGVANHIMMIVGAIDAPLSWFGDATWAMPSVILMNIWFGFPFMMVAIIAGLQAIPRELYEAARVDGASYWQELRFITIPSLTQVIAALVVLRTIWVFNNFEFIFLATGGGPIDTTMTLPLYAFSIGWQQYNIGRMAAVSVIMIIILFLILSIYFRLVAAARKGG